MDGARRVVCAFWIATNRGWIAIITDRIAIISGWMAIISDRIDL
jgi:hypothetical protein